LQDTGRQRLPLLSYRHQPGIQLKAVFSRNPENRKRAEECRKYMHVLDAVVKSAKTNRVVGVDIPGLI
jgi:hypothetical protein